MKITTDDVFLDFETRSRADLTEVGAWRYAEDPSTEILCLAYTIGAEAPRIWMAGMRKPEELMRWIKLGKKIHGWNAMSFERAIFEVIAGPKLGWDTPKLEQYYDTMSDALALALPGSLEKCGEAVGASIKKDKTGKALIQKLCKPISAGKKKGQFREREDFIRDYALLYDYCKTDVKAEREIYAMLPFAVEGIEREIMIEIARMNERGLPIDLTAVRAIERGVEEETAALRVRFHLITGVRSPTERAQFLSWLRNNGLGIDNTQKETFRDTLEDIKNKPEYRHVVEALHLAQAITRTANAKYRAILNSICQDGTVKNNLIYHKANTGRLAGAGFQVQNLPSEGEKEPEPIIEAFVDDDYNFLRAWRGVLEAASGLVRSVIKAFPGKKFLNGDLKGIEMRGSAWTAREWDVLEQLGRGEDPYRITAAKMYGTVIANVTKEQRQAGKICVLAGGFGGAYQAILNMAHKMGIHVAEEDAKKHIKDFRKARRKLVSTWYAFGNAAVEAMEDPGVYKYPTTLEDGADTRFKFILHGRYLFLVLPSGRKLSFPFPRIHEEFYKGYLRKTVVAKWVDSYTKQWSERFITGPSFFQSAVQGLCRDLLMEAHLRTAKAGLDLVLSVHDEQQSQVPDDARYTVKMYEELMCVAPNWAYRFPLDADCWEGYRFKK